MKICVFGAGAIGGYLAAELALAGEDVCVIARGAHLEAIRSSGLTLRIGGVEKNVLIPASDRADAFGHQEYVFCALKAHQAHEHAQDIVPLLGPHTAVVTAMNGIPWWYFYKNGGALDGRHLESVDPGGRQWSIIGPERAIGCVVDPACEVVAPGIIEHHEFNRFTLGEPDRSISPRVRSLAAIMSRAGFDAPVRDEIRWNLWLKLWGNVCFNPISALTHATLDRITTEPSLRALCKVMMGEAKKVSDALGILIDEGMMDRRLAAAGKAVGHKMSMLQDLERGRSMEIDALVTAVQELGRMTGVATPTIDLVLTLVQERALQASLYGYPATSLQYLESQGVSRPMGAGSREKHDAQQ
ncbi:MAG: 2-dehydropantoate 2-reductase [Pseudorhodoplanes sp.]|uniref:2-dehydropantoate 2-reductase n=1 Tax=Pseudorhodoplanes sp. TaxID=1934341 RepID=UPI003D149458